MKKIHIIAGLVLMTSTASIAQAAGVASATLPTGVAIPQPSDQSDWKGDRIVLRSDVTKIKSTDTTDATEYFAPDGAELDVAADDKKTDKLTVKFRLDTLDGSNACADPSFFSCAFAKKQPTRDFSANHVVDGHQAFVVDKAAIENLPHARRGFTFGALLVPFKYFSSDKSFSGSSTIGTYVGYKFQDNRGSFTPVLSAGWMPNISVPTANGGASVSRSGFSLATGVIFSVDKGTGLQLGVLVGQDRLGSNAVAPYQYEGKTWFSLSIGFKFI